MNKKEIIKKGKTKIEITLEEYAALKILETHAEISCHECGYPSGVSDYFIAVDKFIENYEVDK